MLTVENLLFQVLIGLTSGMLLFVVSSGLTLVFGVMRVINFAHGSIYMVGAFMAGAFGAQLLDTESGFWIALIVVPIVIALIGVGIEVVLFRRIYTKEILLQLLLTYGLTLIFLDVVRAFYGSSAPALAQPALTSGTPPRILGRRFPTYNFLIIGASLAIGAGLWFLINRTRWGRFVRAAVANPEILGALGVNVRWVFTGVFGLGCWLAGLGGVLQSARSAPSLGMDADIIIQAFAVVVIGGLGSVPGALIGALIIGITVSVGTLFVSQQSILLPFIVMALVLIIRPWGLLGKPER
jgi:branched-subunit amino acid ABC-type transport system permease component